MDIKQIILDHATVAFQVFVGTFLVTSGTMLLEAHTIVWSTSFFIGILSTAGTAAIKEFAAKFFSPTFGGRSVGSKTLFGSRKA